MRRTLLCLLVVGGGCLPGPAGRPRGGGAADAGEISPAESAAPARPVVIGAILPLTGSLAPYGHRLREGIELALAEHLRAGGDSVHFVVLDDAGSDDLAAERLAELEALGALAAIGPVSEHGLGAAAARRRDDDLVLVAPLAACTPDFGRNVFCLWFSTEDLVMLARRLAEFAVREMRARRLAVIFSNDAAGLAQYRAFAEEAAYLGGEILGAEPYDPAATTFEGPLTRLRDMNPEALYAVAASPQAAIQLAPQISYYGLRGIQIFGDPNWIDPEVIRRVQPRFLNGVVVASYLDRWLAESGWHDFAMAYEIWYAKSLGDNLVSALAYDAASLLLEALPQSFGRRGGLAHSLRAAGPYRGATGTLRVLGEHVEREPRILEVRDGQVIRAVPRPIPPRPAAARTPEPPQR